ncbi:S-adenosyl-L-methionine-dependent methyltransferase [Daedalea quercina L-15889]|uniref:DNA (cytosine-5-)-methyltransferase n=1 Tax=Daedalea quercina L-15889 TaxID=1314783 RepID=A0A165R0A4_9APHY|nr:S-adenosyl-L-methionine-dependent methyltransferase [Daedalea quercina L-15889]
MSRRIRPTAFDVSFPEEASDSPVPLREDDQSSSTSRTRVPKRKERDDTVGLLPSSVKRKLVIARPKDVRKDTPNLQYAAQPGDLYEEADTVIFGEDPDDARDGGLPVRVLSDFSIFDPKADYQLLSLDEENTHRHELEAGGFVSPVYANEEDEGQEDDVEGSLQRLRTTRIERYSLDYETRDDPLYVQTKYAWYQLRGPADGYFTCHLGFYRRHRVTQLLLSSAKENKRLEWHELVESTTRMKDPLLGVSIEPEDFLAAVPLILVVLSEIETRGGESLNCVPAVRRVLEGNVSMSRLSMPAPTVASRVRPPIRNETNLDLAVLRPENQNPTHVTPLIDKLARGWFNERLHVIGAKLPEDRRESEAKRARLWMLQRLGEYIERQMKKAQSKKTRLDTYAHGDRIVDEYWKTVTVDGIKYSVGDTILTPRGNYEQRHERAVDMPRTLTGIPDDAVISDFFWFGRIIHINQARRKLHVQWFDHAPRSILEELGDPRELFLWNSCGEVDANQAYGQVKVESSKCRDTSLGSDADPSVFYCDYMCDEATASFTSISKEHWLFPRNCPPPDNCPPCLLLSQQEQDQSVTPLRDGIAYRGHRYHAADFILYSNAEPGPAKIAQIVRFVKSKGRESAVVRVLGRISDVVDTVGGPHRSKIIKDERHLFVTENEVEVHVEGFIEPCFVVTYQALEDELERDHWLGVSPNHFYVRYQFPSPTPTSWADRVRITIDDLLVCRECFDEETTRYKAFQTFMLSHKRRPLRGFDPFGGIGAFGLGMEESGCIKMCQAVEISPSAAHALQVNSPHVTVHNQCSNVVLEYAIKSFKGHKPEVPRALGHSHGHLPDPPQPSEVDIIIAGFPCQPHSRLNMFQHANDRKSLLILNLLSWVDFLKPKYCVFENVRGFLNYNLHAYQAGRYRVEGGIEMGGLKFLVQAMLAMRYQVCFGLLQAGHYGTPQSRVRFFLIAAQDTCVLPPLPQPTHDFPVVDALELRLANGSKAQPIQTRRGLAPHPFVSVDDAIGDLRRFHWYVHFLQKKDPHKDAQDGPVPELTCDKRKVHCGFSEPALSYECTPRSAFQAKCRKEHSRDLQHFTKVPPAATVKRQVVDNSSIILTFTDFSNLRPDLWEWQFANPSSATAQQGFRPGMYGRLNKDEWFNTTVTNVEPTAKQSWVLHPYCKRMVTVRELARSQGFPDSFIFHSDNGDVKTLHRQIGNAVPWPVADAISRKLLEAVFTKWNNAKHAAHVIEDD